MLSVLIPVFNTDVRSLAEELRIQCSLLPVKAEVIFLDDGSDESWKTLNRTLLQDQFIRYLESERNLGRAAVRNKLAGLANFSKLLFLDGDSVIIRKDFLKCYLNTLKESTVVCGGRIYGSLSLGRRTWSLHRKYGLQREQMPVEKRSGNPWQSFMTNNFLIPREILQSIRFDEQISGYGHEDTLFGYRLKSMGIPVVHIDNPVEHGILESNEEFLEKSLTAAKNLAEIHHRLQDPAFDQEVGLLRFHRKMKRLHLTKGALGLIGIFKKFLVKAVVGPSNSLFCLDLLKYDAFCERLSLLAA